MDEFENGLRLLAEDSGVQVYGVDYRLAPEFKFPTQLDEYLAVVDWLQGEAGKTRGVHTDKVLGGGDSAGGNMTAAIALRRRDEGKKNIAGQILFYPEARLPFDTPAASENNSGYYLECNGIFSFAHHYLPRGTPPNFNGCLDLWFRPLRDVGVEYAHKLEKAGNKVIWHHFETFTHGWLQMTAWSYEAQQATKKVGRDMAKLIYGA
ncbi:hypothetical protein LTS18_009816 [Coniosporium uncinatum]|uniref:Uncharacterized protein n=1 Tax=Coniosporium uncinatum TaxID=93489 RepID=A0ACC3DX68_9PEZI|nr:hypothetical protein LTS18_009816 [Coniosporium uncinatum]